MNQVSKCHTFTTILLKKTNPNFTVATMVSFFRAFMASHRTHPGGVRVTVLMGFLLLYHTIKCMIAYAQKLVT